jgi:antirestriction protein ArdC
MSAATNTRPSEAQRAARRETDRRRIAEAVEQLQSEAGWQRWLQTRRHFHTYSFQNQLLIALQMPEATRVAGFRKWLELGYCVRKGEHGIRIMAPCPPSKKTLERWRRRGADPQHEPRIHFRSVAVFDRSQVEPLPDSPNGPAPLDPPHEPIAGEGLVPMLEPLCELAASISSPVSFEPIDGAAHGYLEPKSGRIVIDSNPGHSANARVATLVHEIAHALVRLEHRHKDPRMDYAAEEVVVESVAYSVCASLGLDTAGDSVPYLAGWGGVEATEEVEAYAGLIDRLAKRIEEALPTETEEER